MSPYKIVVDDIFWKTAEAYFQSLRFAPDDTVRETIRMQKSPIAAKMVAKQNVSRMVVEPMSEQDVENMRITLRLKFKCNQIPLEENLLLTGTRPSLRTVVGVEPILERSGGLINYPMDFCMDRISWENF